MRLGPLAIVVATLGLVASSWQMSASTSSKGETATTGQAADEAPPGDTLVVDFRDDVSAEALATNAWREEPVSRYSERDRLYRVRFPSAREAALAAAELRRDPTVETVDWDVDAQIPPGEELGAFGRPGFSECAERVTGDASDVPQDGGHGRSFPNDPCYKFQWHLAQIGLPKAWKLGQGRDVVVAVIDTGVTKVPDLADTAFVKGYNFVANNEDASDDHGHGTHVAGTIAQATNNALGVAGVAFGAKIMPLKVLSARGSGSMAAIAQAIRYAADNGAHVVNMSLGGPFPVATIKAAVQYARSKGVVVVAAAGNDGRGRVSYPAKYPGVIAVAATQYDETTTFYSNWGGEIDVAAPGGNVRVDQNGDGKPDGVLQNTVVPGDISRTDYLFFMGTSMASPHVAGVAALVVGAGVRRPEAVEAVLLETARRPKAIADRPDKRPGRIDDRYGAGLVDAHSALEKARLGKGASALGIAGSLALLGIAGLRRRGRLAGSLGVGLPLGAAGLLLGLRRGRGVVAGLSFGFAGALAFAAIAQLVDVRLVPDLLDRGWLVANAALAYVLGVLALRK